MSRISILIVLFFVLAVATAHAEPPDDTDPVAETLACDIVRTRGDWYDAARRAELRWGLPVAHQFAFLAESQALSSHTLPARWRPSWTIRWKPPSVPDGAFDATWKQYQFQTGQKTLSAGTPDAFFDFTAWYVSGLAGAYHVSSHDAVSQHILWRHGPDVMNQQAWKQNSWMKAQADAFARRVQAYKTDLQSCDQTGSAPVAPEKDSEEETAKGKSGTGKPGYFPGKLISSR